MSTDKKQEIIKIKAREATGSLFYSIISGVITPFEAIKYFPKNVEDISLKIAWHALLHYDADEEIGGKRTREPFVLPIAEIGEAAGPVEGRLLDGDVAK